MTSGHTPASLTANPTHYVAISISDHRGFGTLGDRSNDPNGRHCETFGLVLGNTHKLGGNEVFYTTRPSPDLAHKQAKH